MRRGKNLLVLLLTAVMIIASVLPVEAKTYYTGNQLYLNNKKVQIVKIVGNKVTYRSVTYVQKDYYMDIKYGKKKTAKLTSKTKYYLGDASRYRKLLSQSNYKKTPMTLKWIYKVNKKTFSKNIGSGNWDQIQIKNGKVVRIFAKMQLAG